MPRGKEATVAVEEEQTTQAPSPGIGDTVLYNEQRGPMPAIVQHVHKDGELRLWVLGVQSIFPKDGVAEGKEIVENDGNGVTRVIPKALGTWSRI